MNAEIESKETLLAKLEQVVQGIQWMKNNCAEHIRALKSK